jgi:hypothetical protein
MTGMNKKKAWYLMVVLCIGMLALWGCPKKAEISAVPETQREETPVAEATAQPEQKVEAAKSEDKEIREQAAAAPAGLQPVYFDFDQAFIDAEAVNIMKANAEWLKAHPQSNIKIEGNCDERGTKNITRHSASGVRQTPRNTLPTWVFPNAVFRLSATEKKNRVVLKVRKAACRRTEEMNLSLSRIMG